MTLSNSTNYSTQIAQLKKSIDTLTKELHILKQQQATNKNNIGHNSNQINSLKYLDSRWNQSTGGSYDPQLPYFIHRKNEKYDYSVVSLKVTVSSINSKLNEYGNAGWMAISMGLVNESDGMSSFTFKRLENSNVTFNYICFKYEKKAIRKFEKTLNEYNTNGYDLTAEAIFNKSASFCLMVKTIY
tara:strand:- start:34569 stop:35126 length:558 start_codon:yes stop_codon:yes gene_type:complete